MVGCENREERQPPCTAALLDVQGCGRQSAKTKVYRGQEFTINLLRNVPSTLGHWQSQWHTA